jgi:hypothetical protein
VVYNVPYFYIIREDIIVRKDIEKYRALYIKRRKEFEILYRCGESATKLVKYSTEGAIIIEKYCDRCAKAIEDSSAN